MVQISFTLSKKCRKWINKASLCLQDLQTVSDIPKTFNQERISVCKIWNWRKKHFSFRRKAMNGNSQQDTLKTMRHSREDWFNSVQRTRRFKKQTTCSQKFEQTFQQRGAGGQRGERSAFTSFPSALQSKTTENSRLCKTLNLNHTRWIHNLD